MSLDPHTNTGGFWNGILKTMITDTEIYGNNGMNCCKLLKLTPFLSAEDKTQSRCPCTYQQVIRDFRYKRKSIEQISSGTAKYCYEFRWWFRPFNKGYFLNQLCCYQIFSFNSGFRMLLK